MTILSRIEQWKRQDAISSEQQARLTKLATQDPFSLGLELNILLYLGVLSFIAGLGWTVSTWSRQLGDVLVVSVLCAILAACFFYCFSRAPNWSRAEIATSTSMLDYVLYLGSLVWCIELAYLETHFHLLSGQWDLYLLATAIFFFLLAYRFDNRFVLSLALSSLAGWFGLSLSHGPFGEEAYRPCALVYCLLVGTLAIVLKRLRIKPHFFGTYLNLLANLLFWTLLSGVFDSQGTGRWSVGLVAAGAASLAWGISRRQFAFVAYAAVYVYIGLSFLLLRGMHDETLILGYLVLSAIAMVAMLILISRRFGRTS